MNPADLLGCFYLSIQIENVFAYGRGARERSEFYWLKASYFTLKFHPRHLITLVTCHDRSPFKNKLGSQNKNRTCNGRLSADCYTI